MIEIRIKLIKLDYVPEFLTNIWSHWGGVNWAGVAVMLLETLWLDAEGNHVEEDDAAGYKAYIDTI